MESQHSRRLPSRLGVLAIAMLAAIAALGEWSPPARALTADQVAAEIVRLQTAADDAAGRWTAARDALEDVAAEIAVVNRRVDLESARQSAAAARLTQLVIERFTSGGPAPVILADNPMDRLQRDALVGQAMQIGAADEEAYEQIRSTLAAEQQRLTQLRSRRERAAGSLAAVMPEVQRRVAALQAEYTKLRQAEVQAAYRRRLAARNASTTVPTTRATTPTPGTQGGRGAARPRTTATTRTSVIRTTPTTRRATATTRRPTATTRRVTATTRPPTATTRRVTATTRRVTPTTRRPTATTRRPTATTRRPTATTAPRPTRPRSTVPRSTRPRSTVPKPPTPSTRPPRANIACPVDGPTAFTDTWGAARSGGRRHKGVDMISPAGTHVVAVVSGRVRFDTNRLGGNVAYVYGDDGNTYYYAHLQGWAGSPGRVQRGQLIGYVGMTGNAPIPHLHFEFRPGGGAAVNPYPIVRAAC